MASGADRKLVTLGYLLFALGALFGITAVIGAIVTHSKIASVENSQSRWHLRAQLSAFWLLAAMLAIAAWQWPNSVAKPVIVVAVALWAITWLAGFWLLGKERKTIDDR